MKMHKQPLVSVVIPCYNHENFVQDCIKSVIDQTYENIELIIIDDGSKDGSVQKIQEMSAACQKRFTRFEFRYRPNKGLSETLNEALEWCEGLYLSPIASDDQMLKQKIQLQVNFLEKNKQSEFNRMKKFLKNNPEIIEKGTPGGRCKKASQETGIFKDDYAMPLWLILFYAKKFEFI